jgi:hypothetical protein
MPIVFRVALYVALGIYVLLIVRLEVLHERAKYTPSQSDKLRVGWYCQRHPDLWSGLASVDDLQAVIAYSRMPFAEARDLWREGSLRVRFMWEELTDK